MVGLVAAGTASAFPVVPASCQGGPAATCVADAEAAGFTMFKTYGVTPSCYSDGSCDAEPPPVPPQGDMDAGVTGFNGVDSAGNPAFGLAFGVMVPETTQPCPSGWGCSSGTTVTDSFAVTPDIWGPGCTPGTTAQATLSYTCGAEPAYVGALPASTPASCSSGTLTSYCQDFGPGTVNANAVGYGFAFGILVMLILAAWVFGWGVLRFIVRST